MSGEMQILLVLGFLAIALLLVFLVATGHVRWTKVKIKDWFSIEAEGNGPRKVRSETREPHILDQVRRFKRVMAAHGMRPEHWSRFFRACNAPFDIQPTDLASDESLLRWIDEEKIGWLCDTFLIDADWMAGEDNTRPHRPNYFNKDPKRFFEVISRELGRHPHIRDVGFANAIFALDSQAKKAERDPCVRLFVTVAVPLCRLSKEVTVYRYIHDCTGGGYPWNDFPYHGHVRALARLSHQALGCQVFGIKLPKEDFEAVENGHLLIPEAVEKPNIYWQAWHPQTYALSRQEHPDAKEAETLPQILEWLKQLDLPTSEPPLIKTQNGQET